MRLVKVFIHEDVVTPGKVAENRQAFVYYHADWKEYFVRFYINGKVQPKMTYPADDRADALERAEWFVYGS